MTHAEKLTAVENAIREALPRLKMFGKELMLNNVLEWLNSFNTGLNNTFDVELNTAYISDGYKKTLLIEKNYNQGDTDWDLSKPYLKDQNEDVINFLYNLINQ